MLISKLFVLAAVVAASVQSPATAADTYIRAGLFFDGRSAPQRDVLITVRGGKIAAVQRQASAPEGAQVIDLGSRTVMPGLVDAHTHIALHEGDYDGQMLRETPEFRAIWAAVNAKKTLEGGVTTIRDLGNEGAGYADVALRDAIARGLVPGPRIVAAIRPVTSTGAYGLTGYSPYLQTPPLSSSADGVAEIRKEVRRLLANGADVIKIYMESFEKREVRKDQLSGAMNYSREELEVIVDEAHRGRVKVAAHTYSDEAARMAIDIGVDSIEHGLYLSEGTFRTMAARGIYYVPTLLVYELWRDGEVLAPVSAERRQQLAKTVEQHVGTFRRALKTPVKIAFGSDTFELPGTNGRELELMVQYGMTPIAALRSGTSVSAALLGVEDETGSLEPGKAADIIALDGNPFEEIRALRRVAFVMKGGAVHVAPR
ncbi:MAG TPA: amidohydrolase family protein [Sphingomicrobium sp.]|nr:amidohydrolase family protein [Sphingomicrobium sp.]